MSKINSELSDLFTALNSALNDPNHPGSKSDELNIGFSPERLPGRLWVPFDATSPLEDPGLAPSQRFSEFGRLITRFHREYPSHLPPLSGRATLSGLLLAASLETVDGIIAVATRENGTKLAGSTGLPQVNRIGAAVLGHSWPAQGLEMSPDTHTLQLAANRPV
jgi:hypothetical protein